MKKKKSKMMRQGITLSQKLSLRLKIIVGASLISITVFIVITLAGTLKSENSHGSPLQYVSISSSSTKSGSGVSQISWIHTSVTGENQLMIVTVTTKDKPVTSITYNGITLTSLGSGTRNSMGTYIYYLKNPSIGTYNLVVKTSSSTSIYGGAEVLDGIDLNTSFSVATNNGKSSLATSGNIVASASEIVYSTVGTIQSIPTPKNSLRPLHSVGSNNFNVSAYQDGASTISSDFQLSSSDDWVVVSLFAYAVTTLPVTWKSFEVKRKNLNVTASWVTASEINNDYFILQRSNDGVKFTDVLSVGAAGNSTSDNVYNAVDNENSLAGIYYRVKQVDYDGKFDYSKIKYLKGKSLLQNLLVYPTIVSNHVSIKMKDDVDYEKYTCKIIDVTGRIISEQTVSRGELLNSIEISTADLKNGNYFISLDWSGNIEGQGRFIKN